MPESWMRYSLIEIIKELTEAKAAVMALQAMPFQRGWAEALQEVQLKREVAGTSRIEGADFTENELDAALRTESPEGDLITRSQKQARAAMNTYMWIAQLPDDRPIDDVLIRDIHRRVVTGADDDHCQAGQIRTRDQNVNFGSPRHRGADGGTECELAFLGLTVAIQQEFRGHDPLIQALAVHYHFAAIHPFLDGNGRTARALEALILQRAGLRDVLFIPMSNYYYDEKSSYLAKLAEARARGHDLTPFLSFGLRGITTQCNRLFSEIRRNVAKEMFRNLVSDFFTRLVSPRKRVIAKRQIEILNLLLKADRVDFHEIMRMLTALYSSLDNPWKAYVRDIVALLNLGAINVEKNPQDKWEVWANLEWPQQITETQFFERTRKMPKAKRSFRFDYF